VGKNEAGKTAFLKALEGLKSTDIKFKQYDKTENYPRRYLAEYEDRHDDDEATVVETEWELSDEEVQALVDKFGQNAITGKRVNVSKSYGSTSTTWSMPINQVTVLSNLKETLELTDDESEPISSTRSTVLAAAQLDKLEARSDAQAKLVECVREFRDSSAVKAAIDVVSDGMPEFLYFSHYDRMSGQVSIEQLAKDRAAGEISEGDQVFLDFLEYSGTTLEELASANQFENLNAKCEAAANRITDQIFRYWTQNDQLSIEVRLDEGKEGDDPPFNSGAIARARVKNELHRVTVPFSERSAGFIWFFSFLVKFAQIKKKKGNVVILLDEPGLTLHGTAQKDLLMYFKEQLEPNHQIVYTTHSPFMVPADNLLSVRTVEDVVLRDDRGRPYSEGTKVRSDVLTTDPQTNFPIFGVLGFEVTQGLIVAPDTVLVEGPSDILYLQAFSNKLQELSRFHLNPKWALCPSGGIDKILPFVRLFYGNRLNTVVLTDFDRGQKRKLEGIYKSELLESERIILATEIADQEEADIEDFFAPALFIDLVNAAYELKGRHKLTAKKLANATDSTDRLVKKVEAYFKLLPDSIPMFDHFTPASYLIRNPEFLDGDSPKIRDSLSRFEEAFERIAKFE